MSDTFIRDCACYENVFDIFHKEQLCWFLCPLEAI